MSIVDSIANLNGSGSKIPEPMWECIPIGLSGRAARGAPPTPHPQSATGRPPPGHCRTPGGGAGRDFHTRLRAVLPWWAGWGFLNCFFFFFLESSGQGGGRGCGKQLGAEVTCVGILYVCRWGGVGASSEQHGEVGESAVVDESESLSLLGLLA